MDNWRHSVHITGPVILGIDGIFGDFRDFCSKKSIGFIGITADHASTLTFPRSDSLKVPEHKARIAGDKDKGFSIHLTDGRSPTLFTTPWILLLLVDSLISRCAFSIFRYILSLIQLQIFDFFFLIFNRLLQFRCRITVTAVIIPGRLIPVIAFCLRFFCFIRKFRFSSQVVRSQLRSVQKLFP